MICRGFQRVEPPVCSSEGEGSPRKAGALHRCQAGTSLTEFVITMPIFLVLLSGLLTFTDMLISVTAVEITAYQATMNTTMELKYTDELDSVGSPENFDDHIHYPRSMEKADEQFSPPDIYPAVEPTTGGTFDGVYRAHMNAPSNNKMADPAASTNRMIHNQFAAPSPHLEPLFSSGVSNGSAALDGLFGAFGGGNFVHQVARGDERRAGHVGDFNNFDNSPFFFDELTDIAEGFFTNSSSLHAAALGSRYGILIRHRDYDIEHEYMMFDYSFTHAAYFSTGVPMHVAEGDHSPHQRATRATYLSRVKLEHYSYGAFPMYRDMLRIGVETDEDGNIVLPDPNAPPEGVLPHHDNFTSALPDDTELFGPALRY